MYFPILNQLRLQLVVHDIILDSPSGLRVWEGLDRHAATLFAKFLGVSLEIHLLSDD